MTPRPRSEQTDRERIGRSEERIDRFQKDLDERYLTQGDADDQYVKQADLKAEVGAIASVWGWKIVKALTIGGGIATFLTIWKMLAK